ncbi:hypothetical protein BN1723_006885 [Verticillium longisporum]|uniref:Uncharacterized protein n=1 Tax=Verticillium longisporum TaxID=100787 RepID=A0A0G4NI96_VERLO|nr:hypothetical protein BN1723_006885 [Verticillium longisporum]
MHWSIPVAIGVARHDDTKLFQLSHPLRQAIRISYFCGPSAGQSWSQRQLLVLNSNVVGMRNPTGISTSVKQTSTSTTHVLDEVLSSQDIRHLFHQGRSVARYATEDSHQCHRGSIP